MSEHDPSHLKEHWFHILLALSGGDLHGSAMVREVLSQTDGELRLWPATLYGSLEEMAGEGLIRELEDGERPEGVSDRRRYYRITPRGSRALAAEAERLAGLARKARERVAGSLE